MPTASSTATTKKPAKKHAAPGTRQKVGGGNGKSKRSPSLTGPADPVTANRTSASHNSSDSLVAPPLDPSLAPRPANTPGKRPTTQRTSATQPLGSSRVPNRPATAGAGGASPVVEHTAITTPPAAQTAVSDSTSADTERRRRIKLKRQYKKLEKALRESQAATAAAQAEAEAAKSQVVKPPTKLIPRPETRNNEAINIQQHMRLANNKRLYYSIRNTVRQAIAGSGLDPAVPFRRQTKRTILSISAWCRKKQPYLTRFEGDWATEQIIITALKYRRDTLRRLAAAAAEDSNPDLPPFDEPADENQMGDDDVMGDDDGMGDDEAMGFAGDVPGPSRAKSDHRAKRPRIDDASSVSSGTAESSGEEEDDEATGDIDMEDEDE